MDVREKLEVIAHLGDHITYKEDIGICYDSALAKVIEDAYMTLKNGVTVQEWISVKDRLPKKSGEYLAYCGEYDGICVLYLEVLKTKSKWRTKWKEVTHWMPIPQPPKGE